MVTRDRDSSSADRHADHDGRTEDDVPTEASAEADFALHKVADRAAWGKQYRLELEQRKASRTEQRKEKQRKQTRMLKKKNNNKEKKKRVTFAPLPARKITVTVRLAFPSYKGSPPGHQATSRSREG
jgi:hypothetical protein